MHPFSALAASTLLLAVTTMPVHADDDDLQELQGRLGNQWMLVKNDQLRHIKTYAKQEDGKRFRSFKVEAMMDGSVEVGVRVLLDFDNYSKWYWEVQESRLLKRVSATEYYMYMIHRAPYGIPNRDVILHAQVEPQGPNHPGITLRVEAVPDYMPARPPLVRMLAEDMVVNYTPQPDNKVLIEASGYVDPGGKVPSWANNFIQRSAPYSILLGLFRMVGSSEYHNSRTPLPFPVYGYGATALRQANPSYSTALSTRQ